jgi:hypothetical protein
MSALNQALRAHPEALALGSQGPDFLFFNPSDILGAIPGVSGVPHEERRDLALLAMDVADALHDVNGYVLRALAELERATQTSDSQEIAGILNSVKAVLGLISSTTQSAIVSTTAQVVDVFSFLTHPMQVCDPTDKWWWFDLLHYRKSGQFATALLDEAGDDDCLLAYAVGYLSHVATDTVGHPYVNMVVRGPYRHHGQRHKVVESYQDVWAFDKVKGNEFVNSDLHLLYDFKDTGVDLMSERPTEAERTLFIDKLEDLVNVHLPTSIAEGVAAAAARVYSSSEFPPLITAREVDAAYRHWYRFMRSTTGTGYLPPHLPGYRPLDGEARSVLDELIAFLESFAEDVFDRFDGGRNRRGWDLDEVLDSVIDFFEHVEDLIRRAVADAWATLEFVIERIDGLTSRQVAFLLNRVYEALYTAYAYFRELVCLQGLGYPVRDFMRSQKVAHMLDPTVPDAVGRTLHPAWPYPLQALPRTDVEVRALGWSIASFNDVSFLKDGSHLLYPPTPAETPETTSAPTAYHRERPMHYWAAAVPHDPARVRALSETQDLAAHDRVMRGGGLGSAVDLTVQFYCDWASAGRPVPDLNLDGDRGFAYPTWEGRRRDGRDACSDGTLPTEDVPVYVRPDPGP